MLLFAIRNKFLLHITTSAAGLKLFLVSESKLQAYTEPATSPKVDQTQGRVRGQVIKDNHGVLVERCNRNQVNAKMKLSRKY